ncbi:hypothetical protein ONZ51_g11937 [Trametes cubensis]|uniref:Uncharacterized protein n=1 Tax=Trametes cubensis TaxID=1111947 RepID=A0AAD7TGZ1_9APHY|nr:hypothetical protein ONZ51_g11937 [Trametes cubensis]
MASMISSQSPTIRLSSPNTIGTIDSLKNADPFGTPINKPSPVHQGRFAVGRPISGCVANLRDLALSSRGLYRAFRDTRGSVSRLNIPERDVFEAEWTAFADRYKNLLDDSDLAASQLIAIIKVFLVLQSKKGDAPEDDMISELDSLRQTLIEREYDLGSQCNELREDVRRDCAKLFEAINSEGVTPLDSKTSNDDSKISELPSKPIRADSDGSTARKVFILWRILNVVDRLRRARKSETQNQPERKSNRSKAIFKGNVTRKEKKSRQARGADRPPAAKQRTQPPHLSQASAASATLEAIKEILEKLEKQEPLFDAFPELAKHLRNEIDAYLRAFEAVKAFPGRRRKALDDAQARVVASSKFWRECLVALNAELSAVELDSPDPVARLVCDGPH